MSENRAAVYRHIRARVVFAFDERFRNANPLPDLRRYTHGNRGEAMVKASRRGFLSMLLAAPAAAVAVVNAKRSVTFTEQSQ